MAPGGGGLPDFTRRGTNYLHTTLLKKYPESNFLDSMSMFFEFSALKIGGVPTKKFSKGSFTRFSPKMAPAGGGILSDFTRRGTNYLHTTLLRTYRKSNFLGCKSMSFRVSAPKMGGGPFERLIYPCYPKNGPQRGGGPFYLISPDVALTTCMQLLLEMTPAIVQYPQHSWLKL